MNIMVTCRNMLTNIKIYIKDAKDFKLKMNHVNSKELIQANIGKERSMAFVIEDIQQNLTEIENFLAQNLTEVDDKQLIQIKDDSKKISERMEKISVKHEKLLQQPINDGEVLHSVQDIGKKYVKLNSHKMNFVSAVNKEYIRREWTRIKPINILISS